MQKAQVIDADVEQRAAAQFRLEFALTSGPLRDKAVVAARADPEGLHDEEAFFFRCFVEFLRIGGVGRKGLLAENVFAGVQAQKRVLIVEIIGRCDIDGFHVGICSQLLVGAIGLGNAVFVSECTGFPRAARAHSDQGLALV